MFAGELAVRDAKGPLTRLFRYLAASTREASVVIDPHRVQLARPVEGTTPRGFAGREDALDQVTRALDLIRRHGFTSWESRAEAEH
ncbi:MAG: hypothetical protein HOW71_14250, partial [Nonomuraea sp.]|nr:hypothetical protein [Nonomuraea sp.]